jgi:hypothetical protein
MEAQALVMGTVAALALVMAARVVAMEDQAMGERVLAQVQVVVLRCQKRCPHGCLSSILRCVRRHSAHAILGTSTRRT